MFINKLEEQPKPYSTKMSYISLFLKTELTCIPSILSKCLGDYYNNALCNGATWVFAFWWILHVGFNKCLIALFKRLKLKQFERDRLVDSLWHLGFFGTSVIYCGATLSQNEVELFNFKTMQVPASNSLPTQVVLGYTLILTFYLHTTVWEGFIKTRIVNMFAYLFLFFFMLSSYILRVVEISFLLSALISIAQVALQIARGFFVVFDQKSFYYKLFIAAFFVVTFAVQVAIYLIVIPLTFIVPLGIKIISDYPNILLLFLFSNLLSWLVAEIYQSIIFKFIYHWLYHIQDSKRKDSLSSSEGYEQLDKVRECSLSLVECSLFLPRDDLAFEILKVRREIQERKNKLIALRKPKNMFVQTLKCMLTINKKLKRRQRLLEDESESSANVDENQQNKLLAEEEKTSENFPDSDVNENDFRDNESVRKINAEETDAILYVPTIKQEEPESTANEVNEKEKLLKNELNYSDKTESIDKSDTQLQLL